VLAIRCREIAQTERPSVWDREDAFQQLDVGNGLFRVHSTSMIHNEGGEVKSPMCRQLSSSPIRQSLKSTNSCKFRLYRCFDVLRWGLEKCRYFGAEGGGHRRFNRIANILVPMLERATTMLAGSEPGERCFGWSPSAMHSTGSKRTFVSGPSPWGEARPPAADVSAVLFVVGAELFAEGRFFVEENEQMDS
jgi:hypothetical protein